MKPALAVSLLNVWVLVGLFLYLNAYTRRRYFTLWSAAWLFYALSLTLSLNAREMGSSSLLLMGEQLSAGVAATFMLWGASVFLNQPASDRLFGLCFAFLLVWSYAGAYHDENPFWAQVPVFAIMGLSCVWTAYGFYTFRRQRAYIGAGLLCVGFLLWGGYLAGYPLWQGSDQMMTSGFFISAVLQLFIAVSMVVLVLEEARTSHQQALQEIDHQKLEVDGLRTRVVSTEELYRSLFGQANEAIIITTADDFRILDLNPAGCRLLGLGLEGNESHRLSAFVRLRPVEGAGLETGSGWYRSLLEQHRVEVARADGTTVPAEVTGAPVAFGQQTAYQFFFREVTERARLEQQLRQAEKLSALGQMISGVAHELNNPLAVIKGYLDLLLSRPDVSKGTKADLEKVAHESNRAAKLVSNFLSFAREKPIQRQSVDLNRLVRRVLELREMDFRALGVQSVLELDSDLPQTRADGTQLEQVLVNLVTNALHALAQWPKNRRLKISTQVGKAGIVLKVEDSGPGIPVSVLPHIFEPFFTTKEVGSGTGLGLSIAHSILSEHNGRLFYEPSPEGGAGFVVELPLISSPSTDEEPDNDSAAFAESVAACAAPAARILVLDDERVLAELLAEILSTLGHTPVICCSALRALELVEDEPFDLILSDFRMPVMNGQEFYVRVRQSHPALARRIVFLTGDVVNQETQAFLSTVGNPHLSKPFRLDTIAKVISEMLPGTRERVSAGVCDVAAVL